MTLTRERAGGRGSPQPLVEGGGGGVAPGLGSGVGLGDGVDWGAPHLGKLTHGAGAVKPWRGAASYLSTATSPQTPFLPQAR